MNPIRIGIIGLGYWGPHLLRNFAAQDDCEVVYGCDLKESNQAKLRKHYPAVTFTGNDEDIFSDPSVDLVIVATPTKTHFPLAQRALEAGKHVFIEKPMTSTSKESEELVALAKKQGKRIFVDHTFVFTPAVGKIVEFYRDGVLGTLLYYDSVRINLGIIQRDANVLEDLAVHDISILSAFTDLTEIVKVSAFGSKFFGVQEEDAHLHLVYKSGFSAHIHVSWLSPVKIRQTILGGTKAMATYHDTEPSEKLRLYDRGVDHDDTQPDPFFPKYRAGDVLIPALPLTEALSNEALHVLRVIRKEEEPRASGEDGANIVRILELANQSMREQKTIEL